MCKEMRDEVLRLLEKLKLTQAEVVRRINENSSYRLTRPEFNTYLKGLSTPKANRVLMDALKVLLREEGEREALLSEAKNL
ncbi:hypothetical protein [Adlercreutzia sp. ZJ242]|uniref:hypothetical protein n=1 Tax=Adlercreutzia sp. ZJ242 TaxID=2709409 RepID=UPI0013EBF4FF|nr:hypothetical protein [Adlercreutzia sp. ZJ242]